VQAELSRRDLTLPRWLVLDCLATMWSETGDMVSQKQVSRRLLMDEATLSLVMDRLLCDGLIDRAPAYPGPEYRIYLSEAGKLAVAAGRAVLDAVSVWMSAELGVDPSRR
jgi:DNA-binding MarR family transcriptional regulator